MSNLKRTGMIVVGVIVILALLNPGATRFKEYKGIATKDMQYVRRTSNFFVFSIYTYEEGKYVGTLLNFFDISPTLPIIPQEPKDSTSAPAPDSTMVPY